MQSLSRRCLATASLDTTVQIFDTVQWGPGCFHDSRACNRKLPLKSHDMAMWREWISAFDFKYLRDLCLSFFGIRGRRGRTCYKATPKAWIQARDGPAGLVACLVSLLSPPPLNSFINCCRPLVQETKKPPCISAVQLKP